ncbi:MFS transporter [bacterium]|nr:MFS transporter [bacterium]
MEVSTSKQEDVEYKPTTTKNNSKGSLVAFFFTAYALQGFACAQFGIVGQPVQYFLMDGLKMNAADISFIMSVLMIPWIIKPIYGLISDSIPFLGYHRKSYLVIASLLASAAFLLMGLFCSLSMIISCLTAAAAGMAVSTALMVAVAVDRGRDDGQTREYFRIQECGYYFTNIFVVIGAGYLCHIASPVQSLKMAALIAAACALALSLITAVKLDEARDARGGDLSGKIRNIFSALTSSRILYILLLTCLWNFTLAYGASLYYHESKTLLFEQSLIGQLSAWMSFGTLTGALIYNKLVKGLSNMRQSIVTATLLVISVLAYSFLNTPISAMLIELLHGFANMFAVLTIYGLASDVCKKGAEASTMSLVVCVLNLSTSFALFLGGQLFTYVLGSNYNLLVMIASLPPALSLIFIKFACKQNEASEKMVY